MERLLQHLASWKPFTALVVGDFMLDEMWYGDAERLSADAPVPVLHVKRREHNPGGAANLCLDLAAMRGRVLAFGVAGADPEGRLLRACLADRGVDAEGLIEDEQRPTTVKRNLIGLAQARHPQKMFRADFESKAPLSDEAVERLLSAIEARIDEADCVCIEDYAKGVCSERVCRRVVDLARERGKPVFVDPAAVADYAKYRGATTITPNRTEAERATGLTTDGSGDARHNAALAAALLADLALECVVLTLDRHGALLLEPDSGPVSVPTVARDVYDVTGAGDMFLAALAAARCNRMGWTDAVRFANAAAGLEVEVFGCVPIPLEKIHAELLRQRSRNHGKVRTLDEVLIEAAAVRAQGRKVVFTNGCFDVLHAGHVALIDAAAALGDFLVVGLNNDASVRRLKGESRPVNSQDDRARVLGALAGVGAIVLFGDEDDDTPLGIIRALRPDVLVKGADYTVETVVGADIVLDAGGRVELVELIEGRSTTRTIEKMRSA